MNFLVSLTPGVALFNLVGSGSGLLALFGAVCSLEGGATFVFVAVLVEVLAAN